jgi:hypothetical protein
VLFVFSSDARRHLRDRRRQNREHLLLSPPLLSFDFVGIHLGFSSLRCHRLRGAVGSVVELDNSAMRI